MKSSGRIIVLSTAQNAGEAAYRCIKSVRSQTEPHHHQFILDPSTDDTEQHIDRALRHETDVTAPWTRQATTRWGDKESTGRIHLNTEDHGCTKNLFDFIHAQDPADIIVWLDGDDQLAHPDVLSRIRKVYDTKPYRWSPDVWMTWGQFGFEEPNHGQWHRTGWARDPYTETRSDGFDMALIQHVRRWRNPGFFMTHLKTFRAGLFQQIKATDLQTEDPNVGARTDEPKTGGRYWMRHAIDLAIMFPMVEMAQERHLFVPEVLCIYNNNNPRSDHNSGKRHYQMAEASRIMWDAEPYHRLAEQPW